MFTINVYGTQNMDECVFQDINHTHLQNYYITMNEIECVTWFHATENINNDIKTRVVKVFH